MMMDGKAVGEKERIDEGVLEKDVCEGWDELGATVGG
jgi:hypothetical protein|tara:strand:+ start:1074 stop:1184 length:111 start_codon:yes stop_codon:yes gene_type:complete